MSKRGQTCCPGCKKSFNNRCKPEKCDQCSCYLGGDFVPSEKKQKLNAPKSVLLFSRDGCSFYSVKTHSKDSRCLVIVDLIRNVKQCLAQKCKEVRAAYVNSCNAELFACEHTTLCENAVPPMKVYSLTDGLIDSYPCDQGTKAALNHLKQSSTCPAVFQVSSVSFCVNGVATASNSVGFCHIKNTNSKFVCASSDCARFASKTKAAKHKKICMHQHVLLCILQSSGEPATASGSLNETAIFSSPSAVSSGSSNEIVTFSSRSASSSGSSNETVTFSSPSAASPGSSNETVTCSPSAASSGSCYETVTFSSPSEASFGSSNETAFTATSQDFEVSGRQATLELKMQLSFPYDIPKGILQNILHLDSQTVLNGLGWDGWPSVYEPKEEICALCEVSLSSARPHPGQKTGDCGYLITNAVAFQKITILVKHCPKCKALVQVFPYDLGLFNISDKLLVSLDILLEWREEFKRGVPPTVAVESKLATLIKKTVKDIPSSATLEYVTDLLYNGFYCFEAMTERDLDQTICGICGVVGEIYLGDGNEKNCCSRKEISYDRNDSVNNDPLSLEELLERIKQHWVERTTYTRSSEPFSVNAFSLPPIIPRKMRGEAVFNTEVEKKTYSLSKGKSTVEGDPAKLHIQIRDFDVDLQSLEELSWQELRALCEKCDIPVTSNKSQQCLRGDIQQLYATLLLGDCPCHGFTQVPGKTGGFYHLVCRHGVTVASKFLTLQESVRDAADLYLSLKHPPPIFVCDTPCGFVRHMDFQFVGDLFFCQNIQ
ncbi:uncharacterized protein [Montipora capricornis]|uniref:uncharacterized protein isoform X1 n=1 Tax=Montipora capricornis TaxID=246305 RepID=UPI0035F14EFB